MSEQTKRNVCEEAWVWMEMARVIAEDTKIAAQSIQTTVLTMHAYLDGATVPARRYIERIAGLSESRERDIALSPDERVIACLLMAEQAQAEWRDKMVTALSLTECSTANGGTYTVHVVGFTTPAPHPHQEQSE